VSGASVEVNIKFVSLNPDVSIFCLYGVFTQILIKIMHLYIIQLYVSKLPCGTHFFLYVVFTQILMKIMHLYYSTVCFKTSMWNSYQEQLEMDIKICRS
jgi:hypothetical protein